MEIILLRHGESTANAAGTLAGRDDAVDLTERGLEQVRQARALIPELAGEDPIAVFSSPVHRCVRTAEELLRDGARADAPAFTIHDDLTEVEYGTWTGRPLKELLQEPLWQVIRRTPTAARFPEGESLAEVAVRSRRALDSVIAQARDAGARTAVLISHGDVIKLVLAHALGLETDRFQRIAVAPASVSRFVVGKPESIPPMTVTMVGATAGGRRPETRAPGGGR